MLLHKSAVKVFRILFFISIETCLGLWNLLPTLHRLQTVNRITKYWHVSYSKKFNQLKNSILKSKSSILKEIKNWRALELWLKFAQNSSCLFCLVPCLSPITSSPSLINAFSLPHLHCTGSDCSFRHFTVSSYKLF